MSHGPDTSAYTPPAEGSAPSVGHAAPWQIMAATFVALLFLTWLTVTVSGDTLGLTGSAALWLAMIIATVKATLVCTFFMHLRWDRPFNAIAFVASLLFIVMFIGIAVADSLEYKNKMIPPSDEAYAPKIQRIAAGNTEPSAPVTRD